jgi:hypothetical protein
VRRVVHAAGGTRTRETAKSGGDGAWIQADE